MTAGLVLVHGGVHAADSWEPTISAVRTLAPDVPVLAVDLPGRAGKPGDLTRTTIADWEQSIIADVEAFGSHDVVIVGHSMAGVTVPGVATRLGQPRVRRIVLIAAIVPIPGTAIVDTLGGFVGPIARRMARSGKPGVLPTVIARYAFCNGVTSTQKQFTLSRLHPDSLCIPTESVRSIELPDQMPRSWIMTTRDRALSERSQHLSIAALGGDVDIVRMDACHDVMISHPQDLAAVLVTFCRRTDSAISDR